MRHISTAIAVVFLAACAATPARAELTSPQVGWAAEFGPGSHNSSGVARILDDDTLQIEGFTYDGGGLSVYFYLGETETSSAFANGLPIGPQLLGMTFDGTQEPLVIDLPGGETLEGYHAISVWCVTAGVSFASGTFAPVDPLFGDYNDNGAIDAADYTAWRDAVSAGASSLTNDSTPGTVDEADFAYWRAHFGEMTGSGSGAGSAVAASPVPEPATLLLTICAAGILFLCR